MTKHLRIPIITALVLLGQACSQTQSEKIVRKEIEEIERIAAEKYPGVPAPEARELVARERSIVRFDSLRNEGQRANLAADEFLTYLNFNTKSRVIFCNNLGINISPFAQILIALNSSEINQANKIYNRLNISYDTTWAQVQSIADEQVQKNMQSIASEMRTNLKGVCELFRANPTEMADALDYEVTYPENSQNLMQFKP